MKKYLLLIPFFFLAAPSALAYDFGAAGYIAAIGTTAIGVAAFVGTAPALATLAIGAAIMGVTFDKTETTGSPIVVQISPAAKLQTPSGWTDPASGSSDPVPPSSVPAQPTASYNTPATGANVYTDPTAAAIAACSTDGGTYSTMVAFDSALTNSTTDVTCTANHPPWASYISEFHRTVNRSITNNCPTGYSESGGACQVTDPSQVMKPSDGACGIKRVGNTFSEDSQDPDCSLKPAGTTVSPNQVTQTKPDGSSKTVTINGDGSTTVSESRPNSATNTTETNTTNIAAPDASGNSVVSGQASGSTNGTGTAGTGTPVPTFDKSGLATEGTLAGIKSDTGAIKDALTNSSNVDGSLSAEKSAFDAAADVLAGMFSSEGSTTSGIEDDFSFGGYMPAQCGCQPLSMTFRGHSASFDWCTPMETMKSAFAWLVGLLTAFYVLSLFRVGGN